MYDFMAFPSPTWLWASLCVVLPVLLAIDVLTKAPTPKQAAYKTAALAGLAGAFALALAAFGPEATGKQDGIAFFTAYVVELSLSVDNLFVFLLLFQTFRVPKPAIARVLSAGIFGALVLRALFIGSGLWLVERFSWLFYVFGAFLVVSGAKLLKPEGVHDGDHKTPWLARLCQRLLPMASAEAEAAEPSAFTLQVPPGRRVFTTLALVLVAVEASDIVFALDSVPAGFAITRNGWLLFAANAMAILGLRALFVALDDSLRELRYLRPALAVVLMFIGLKMLLGHVVEMPMILSLGVIVAVLGVAIGASLLWPAADAKNPP